MARQRDEAQQILRFGSIAVGVLVIAACLLGIFVPFRVNLKANMHEATGTNLHTNIYGQERTVDREQTLHIAAGELIFINEGEQAEIEVLQDLNAYAYLSGPANWHLTTAWRRATVLGHVFNNTEAYEIVIEQDLGTALYDFSHATVPLEQLDLTLRFPDQEFRPTSDCFQASAAQEGQASSVVPVPCAAEPAPDSTLIPTEEPIAPPSP